MGYLAATMFGFVSCRILSAARWIAVPQEFRLISLSGSFTLIGSFRFIGSSFVGYLGSFL